MNAEKSYKRWCFTCWDFNQISRLICKKSHLFDYFIIGEERSPTQNRIHYQCYCIAKRPYSLSSIKFIIDAHGHFEPAYGTDQECINYCSKEKIVHIHGQLQNKYYEEDVFDVFGILKNVDPKN